MTYQASWRHERILRRPKREDRRSAQATDGQKSQAARTFSVLRRALEQAVRWKLIPRNPAAFVDPPKVRKEEIKPLDAEQTRTLLRVAGETGDRYEALYVLSLAAGFRMGEALGLKWSDQEDTPNDENGVL
jgi:integrase